jgi:hypothetical protein
MHLVRCASEYLAQSLGQKKTLQDRRPGMMHALIFFGFLGLFIGTDVIAVEEDFTIPLLGANVGKILVGDFYRPDETILDAVGLLFVAGLIWATWRRYKTRPERLHERQYDREAFVVVDFCRGQRLLHRRSASRQSNHRRRARLYPIMGSTIIRRLRFGHGDAGYRFG